MIRRYQPQDLDRLIAMWAVGAAFAHPLAGAALLLPQREQFAAMFLAGAETLVYAPGREALAAISLRGSEVVGLLLQRNLQRDDVGAALLDAALTLHDELTVEVLRRNHRARRFFEDYGFAITGKRLHPPTGLLLLRLTLRPAAAEPLPGGEGVEVELW